MTRCIHKLLFSAIFIFIAGVSLVHASEADLVDPSNQAAQAAQKAADRAARAAALVASAAQEENWTAPVPALLYLVPIVVFFGCLLAISQIKKALSPTGWSFADAMSEEVLLPCWDVTEVDGVKKRAVRVDSENKPVLIPEMRASVSRVIAMMGMIVLLFLFVGFGTFAMFSFGSNGSLPAGIDGVINFLLSGMALFAPYAVNKFASVFQGLAGGK